MIQKLIINKFRNNSESIISLVTRIINAISFYILTSISSRYLISDDFAKWSLFITFLNLLPIFNFGISTGLVNKMSLNNSILKKNLLENCNLVNAGFKLQFLISLFFIILVLIFSFFKFNNTILNSIVQNKFPIIILFISLPFQFYSSLLYSYNQINLANYMSIIQNLILLFGSFFTYLLSKNLNTFILFYSISYTILISIFFAIAITKNNIILSNNFRDLKYITIIKNTSLSFWVMSFFSNLLSTAQVLFVSFIFGLKSVSDFFLFQRLFSIINTLHLAFLSPYTVKFINLAANNNFYSLKQLISNLVKKFTIGLYLTLGLFIFLLHPLIFNIWIHKIIHDYNSAFIFLIIFFISSLANVYSVLLNSLGYFRIQIILSILAFISFFIFLYLFKNTYGSISVALATIPSSLIILIFMIKYTNRIISKNIIILP